MNTSLKHLPEQKQYELQQAVKIIREEVQAEMIILFGSYARGDWVEDLDPETMTYRYQSDFDLLIITKTLKEASKIEQNNLLKYRLMKTIPRTPIGLIAENIDFVNRSLQRSQYFFIDIKREGVLLYNSANFKLAKPKQVTPKERKLLAQEDFEYWFTRANGFLKMYNSALKQNELNIAAFLLHQATERFYNTILLVFTRYKPRTHDLEKLGQYIASVEPQFLTVFPQSTATGKLRFELLRSAYVDARYKRNYKITEKQLVWLAERVAYLQTLTERLCQAKIESFEG